MRKLYVGLFTSFLLLSCASVDRYNAQINNAHTPEALQKDVDIVYRKLQRLHPRLYTYISKEELDAKFRDLKMSITTPLNSRQFYKRLASVVAEVRQGHAGVIPPMQKFTKKERKELSKKKFEFHSLNFEHLDHNLWVESTLGEDSTLVGSKLLKVGGEPVGKLVEEYKRYFASDGYNTTFYDKKVARNFAKYYYADKGYLDSLAVTFSAADSVYTKVFRRILKDSTRFEKEQKDSATIEKPRKLSKEERVLAKRERKKKLKEEDKYGYIKAKKYYHRNLDFIGEEEPVAYMQIRSFTYGNYKDFYEEAFKKIDSAQANNLILDLRNNGGGRLSEIHTLYSYLTDTPFQFIQEGEIKTSFPTVKSFMSGSTSVSNTLFRSLFVPALFVRDILKTHKKEGKKVYRFKEAKLKPAKDLHFSGSVYVLINGYSFSASSVLTNYLQATNRALVVGEESGGAYNSTVAGQTKVVTLPNSKLDFYFGMMVLETPFKTEIEGYGVQPDVPIVPTHQDRIQHLDPELDWVLQHIKKTRVKNK
ncbi:S41 family peptidase [Cellulophaga sp. F20128]|uniref:S41 family peptidase n=1 Tax=Cellulophaga sp. F20128 TaxID=2926413 RepID=UPI001FF39563|nr:S41 family peptidase [Cellulophaga sp. F20128]MCK0155971.1 S41 family peptidase [Cellulophaga sp. F20128]